jgi:hypothetical protein
MFHKVTCRALALAACGWIVTIDASALTVGRARGAVLVGRPLELTVPVALDGQAADDPCASAEVYYGEQRVRREPTVRWEPGTDGQGMLRVISPLPVDEPVVTVYLRVGCGQSTTRRFVLLSEMPPDNEVATLPRILPVPAPLPVQPPAARRGAIASAPAAPAPATRARRPEPAESRPRLKLEPLDLGPERGPVLRLSSELRSEVATDPQRRAAAAALWQALQKGPEEALQDALRLQALDRELKSLRDETQQNAASVARMRAEVERARGERGVAGTMAVGLSVLLLALLGWVGWRWYAEHRLRRVGRWFEEHGEDRLDPPSRHGGHGLRTQPAAILREGPPAPGKWGSPAGAAATVGFAAAAATGMAAGASGAAAPARAAANLASPGTAARDDFLASRGGITRMVGVQELIEVHDKADFFLSIGEVDQAVALLEAHVHDDVETSALAWMDLLELYHSLGRRAEYERLRAEFRQRFTGNVPEFDQFDEPSAPLENYSRALGRIVALWPSPRVLEVIEESIFRKPGVAGAEHFSLEAYRELVLLYHVAQEVIGPDERATAPDVDLHDVFEHPLGPVDREAPATGHDRLLVPPPSARLGVDIDLGEPAEPRHAARELPGLDFDLDEPTTTPPMETPGRAG